MLSLMKQQFRSPSLGQPSSFLLALRSMFPPAHQSFPQSNLSGSVRNQLEELKGNYKKETITLFRIHAANTLLVQCAWEILEVHVWWTKLRRGVMSLLALR